MKEHKILEKILRFLDISPIGFLYVWIAYGGIMYLGVIVCFYFSEVLGDFVWILVFGIIALNAVIYANIQNIKTKHIIQSIYGGDEEAYKKFISTKPRRKRRGRVYFLIFFASLFAIFFFWCRARM